MTEDTNLTLPACHNQTNLWQGAFRLGWFDAVAARYALEVTGGVDSLAVTNLDRLTGLSTIKVADRYENALPCFFTPDRILPQPVDLSLLAERTAALEQIKPHYQAVPGWSNNDDVESMDRYVDKLSELIRFPVHAISTRPDHQKVYRQFFQRISA